MPSLAVSPFLVRGIFIEQIDDQIEGKSRIQLKQLRSIDCNDAVGELLGKTNEGDERTKGDLFKFLTEELKL